ncbi:T2 family ribonuclease [Aspergillus candidus]|uniref:ribonuclease T2 n=1 Tax=Aspergillus candidus TaxID=41067 RepID=A0A2I2EYG7_ASPCN|nr:putative ribonuclease T2 [Aspergillus candidus]PLB33426.1 putative ribonuclease T2 [Aspergillus candidus]
MTRTVSKPMGIFAFSTLVAGVLAGPKACEADTPLSCQGDAKASCCFNAPGGALLLTQFWDTDPVTGPDDSWTLHGLWPDNCDGTYESNCDNSREYSNITDILEGQERTELLADMNKYWKDYKGDDETFWSHEWDKHGTCVNTIEPDCYEKYTPQVEVGDYFQKAVDLFKKLDTYKALADAGIKPDESKTYELSEIEAALAKLHGGKKPSVSCDSGALNQAWYFYNVQGNAIDGKYEPAEPLADSGCPKDGIKYLPK